MPKPYQVRDHYFRRAKVEGFRARSAYKLEEIQKRFHIIKKDTLVLDLGCAPGSFLQKIAEYIGPQGHAFGIDLQKINPLANPNIHTAQIDIYDQRALEIFLKNSISQKTSNQFDCITADLAPSTSGIKDLDIARSIELNEQVLQIAALYLKPDGNLITKIFEGEGFSEFYRNFKTLFSKSTIFKPHSSRDRSRERFLIGIDFRGK